MPNRLTLQDWQEEILEREGFNKPPNKGLFLFRNIRKVPGLGKLFLPLVEFGKAYKYL